MKTYLPLIFFTILSSGLSLHLSAQSGNQLLKDVEVLASDQYEGRKTGTKGAEMARVYIRKRFQGIGLSAFKPDYAHTFTFGAGGEEIVKGINLLGYIKGKTDEVIVISAHYDHLGIIDNQVFNGADDNASGVAGLLYIAEYFTKNKPQHTLVFAAFDAEEMGLRGAKAFVAGPPIGLDKVRLNINMDMISHNDKNELYACGTFRYPELKKFLFATIPSPRVIAGHDDPKTGSEDWTNQSDQAAFHARGIPFLYFGVEDHKDYHKASDEYAYINPGFFKNAAQVILDIVKNIDRQQDIRKIFRSKLKMNKQ